MADAIDLLREQARTLAALGESESAAGVQRVAAAALVASRRLNPSLSGDERAIHAAGLAAAAVYSAAREGQ